MKPFRFLFIVDPQLGCYAAFSGMNNQQIADFARRGMKVRAVPAVENWEWDAARLVDAVQAANALAPDFVVFGGDLINDVGVTGQVDTFKSVLSQLDSNIAAHMVPGNHDVADDAMHPSEAHLKAYCEEFGPDHYAFEHKGASFVVMNTVLLACPNDLPERAEAQLAFLEAALREAAARTGPTVVFGHHPLFLERPDEEQSYWSVDKEQRRRALDLFVEYGVDLVLSGHLHRGAHGSYEQVELVTASAVGFPLGDDPSGFLVVDVAADGGVRHRYQALDRQGWNDG